MEGTMTLIYPAIAGIGSGIFPLMYGASKGNLAGGFVSLIICVIAGLFGGLIIAVPLAGILTAILASGYNKQEKTRQEEINAVSSPQNTEQTQKAMESLRQSYENRVSLGAAQVHAVQPISESFYHYSDSTTIVFNTYGSLLMKDGENWKYIGRLPQTVSIKGKISAAFMIRGRGKQEYVSEFKERPEMSIIKPENVNIVSQLSELDNLRRNGAINQEEFEVIKASIVDSLNA